MNNAEKADLYRYAGHFAQPESGEQQSDYLWRLVQIGILFRWEAEELYIDWISKAMRLRKEADECPCA